MFADLIAQRNLSRNFIRPLVTASSFIEMICGAFLAFGIFREITLYLLAVDMLLVAFMFGLLKPLWDMSHYFPRFVLLVLLLLLPPEWDKFHLGFLFNF
jgi:putative oxidoreductase